MFGAPNRFMAPPSGDEFRPVTVPAPVGGLNAYDSIVAMPEGDAMVLQNWWPQPFGCSVRKGYVQWATGLPSSVETLAGWSDQASTDKLFAWSSTAMYDISSRAAVGAALVSGLSNARWEHVIFSNTAGNYLICVNATDNGIIYRSAGVARLSAGDGIVANTWAGLDPVNASMVTVHQRRLWALQASTTKGWYLPADAVQGTFVSFDFGPQLTKGGNIQILQTWTADDGSGADDYLVAISSRGEAVVYAGTDPSDATKWGLVGVYFIGAPVTGKRCITKAGGDLLVLTQRGLVSMNAELASTKPSEERRSLESHKIQFLLAELVATYTALNGWSVIHHPPTNMTLVGIPSVSAGGNVQLALNHIIGSWTQFTNMDAASWISYSNELYFGDYDGVVYRAWSGYSDNVLLDNSGGEGVTATVQQAYTYFGKHGTQKQVGMYRPTFIAGGNLAYNCKIEYNFVDDTVTTPTASSSPTGSLWGSALWGTSTWGGGSSVTQSWVQAEGVGVAASLKMVTQSDDEVLWVSTDYTLKSANGVL
jgi:hypothetical protein